ncbi:MAG: tetratricopeptide repeat protein [Rickettsiales bacterium]|jgi:tetratricopeptide (TPR) repeat protein|nr:tetratricopeptide repeat protein [Rickettsiales bacterium]
MFSGEYEKAIKLSENIIPIVLISFGKDSVDYILATEAQGYSYVYLEDYQKALPIFEQNISIVLTLLGKGNREALSTNTKHGRFLDT